MTTRSLLGVLTVFAAALAGSSAEAQPLGTFRWQLQPYCNVVTVAITQNGGVYRLEGTDDQCGPGGESASVIGTAFANPTGSIGFGLNIVSAPGGAPGHIEATVTLPNTSGTWRDSAGHAGAFIFTPGAGTGGSPRPTAAPTVTIGATGIDPAQVQLRVSGSCTAGLFMQSIGQAGTVGCAAASGGGGGITAVAAGTGLAGGGTSGAITLALRTVGVGTLDFGNQNGLVSAGTFGTGSLGAAGAGTRLLWYPRKGAFRAGTVAGNDWDDVNIGSESVALTKNARASGASSVAIGESTTASGVASTALGSGTTSSAQASTALGYQTTASGAYSTALGFQTTASGATSVAMGSVTRAEGLVTTVMGTYAAATAAAPGSFVYGDRSTVGAGSGVVTSISPNQFLIRAAGGTFIWSTSGTNFPTSPGVVLLPGDSQWSNLSDVDSKENFTDLPGERVLAKLAAMPVRAWNYKAQDAAIRHVGPTAQDFHAAFGLGTDPRRIGTVDADGIALAGVKALDARTRATNDALAHQNAVLTREVADLRARLARLEALLDKR